eukprot:3538601-Amphidinium_carterae.2
MKWLKAKGYATMARETSTARSIPLDVVDLEDPEHVEVKTPSVPADTAVATDTLPRVTEVPARRLTEEDIRSALQEASQEVAQEREEESKKRQKEQKRAEQDESRAKKAKEVHEFLNTAPSGSVLIDTKIIQAYLQEKEQAKGPLSTFSYENSEDSFNEPVPIYHPPAALPYRVRERLKGLGYVNEDTWCYNLSSGFARTFEHATLYVGRARFLMDLIDGLERTCDANAVRDKILLLKEHLRDFFPRFEEWEKWLKIHVDDVSNDPYFSLIWVANYVREVWMHLVATTFARPRDTKQPDVSAAKNGAHPGLHINFNSVAIVTIEAVLLTPLYLLGIYKSWSIQMDWNMLPNRVMDVYKHLHARCHATEFNPSIP